uniref:Alpha-2-macroglobulin-like n=1 Tax=Maylandia zebra TaxID=106582 RepID=A0A3P9BWY8_9CICH
MYVSFYYKKSPLAPVVNPSSSGPLPEVWELEGPYLVAIPAVIEAGAEAKFCATLRQPSGTLVMTVTLMSREKNTTLFTHTSNEAFQTCVQFEAPLVRKEVQHFQVEVRGDTFYSKQVRKVMIQASDPVTFIQTDKPIYLPGQKGNNVLLCYIRHVTVTPGPSSDYTLTPLSGDLYTSCLCANERKTLRWTMIPTALGAVNVTVSAEAVASHVSCDNEVVSVPDRGRIDVVTKSLIVKAEGSETTKTYNWLLCPKGSPLTEEAEIHLPENVIEGSARTSVSVLGDILGRALKNLDGLLQMPYGCGEQNMALLAPNIYILHYLKGTQQLTAAIMEKATNFLTSGYQRQLNYKSADGAYTTFGTGPGNTWLTAFVVRSFAKAQSFIFIDPRKIEESKTWLQHKQQENGCFEKSGKLFNNGMKGGVSDEVTLSAYVTAAFLEMNTSQHDPVMNKSLACLKESLSDLSNTYTTALLAYVFTLAGDVETRAHLLQHLDTVAVREGGFLYWSQTAAETSASLSVEISSYVLLAKLSASPTAEDLGYASGIIRWLTGQQNYYGGFSSTQDTVVALQALALYSTLVFSAEGWSTVTVQAPSSQLTFDVNQGNKLLYQEEALQDVSGKYRLEVKGTACCVSQISATYNIPTPADVTTLSVRQVCTQVSIITLFKHRYSGKEETTNMVILDIKMLSGFSPDPESLKSLKRGLLVSRVEQKEDHVLVYLESLEIIQELPVDNLKPAVVKIYDYYQPGPSLTKLYSNSTLTHFRGSIRLNSSYKLMFPSVTQRNDTFMFFYHVSVR